MSTPLFKGSSRSLNLGPGRSLGLYTHTFTLKQGYSHRPNPHPLRPGVSYDPPFYLDTDTPPRLIIDP